MVQTGLMLLRSVRPTGSAAAASRRVSRHPGLCRRQAVVFLPADGQQHAFDRSPLTGSRPSGDRLIAVDALRGFDMLWIVGVESMIPAMVAIDTLFSRFVARQLDHAAWQGFTFFDLIFPLFLFIVGIAIVLWLEKVEARGGLRAGWSRVLPRVLPLFGSASSMVARVSRTPRHLPVQRAPAHSPLLRRCRAPRPGPPAALPDRDRRCAPARLPAPHRVRAVRDATSSATRSPRGWPKPAPRRARSTTARPRT